MNEIRFKKRESTRLVGRKSLLVQPWSVGTNLGLGKRHADKDQVDSLDSSWRKILKSWLGREVGYGVGAVSGSG